MGIQDELEKDLLRAAATGKVLYLEGYTDVAALLALLGSTPPLVIPGEGLPHEGIWIRGLSAATGSGGKAVAYRTQAALDCKLAGIHGVIDGDGETYERLAAAFDAPGVGQPRQWKAYCIENLLAQVGWPPAWGAEPDWRALLADYIPHSALNRVRYQLVEYEKALGIAGYDNPVAGKPLKTREEILARLTQCAATPNGIDLVATYERELTLCEQALATSLLHAHALVNGKWFIQEYAMRRTRQGKEECRRTWTDHVASVGGHPEVRAWWERFRAS
jgi:hypothetical protein